MSFSTNIKKELNKINNLAKKEQIRYELAGYICSNNTVQTTKAIKFSTENEYNINRYAKLLKNIDVNDYKIEILGKVFSITSKNYLEKLADINYVKFYLSHENRNCARTLEDANNIKEENIKAFIRGLYMGAGSINNPENKYHLEVKIPDKDLIQYICQTLRNYDINVKEIEHGIYIKEGEEISKFLAFIGANKSVLEFEQIRVQRDMNNKINRLVNCKTANLNKVINASVEQINVIKRLKETGKFNKMDKSLQELAELRLEFPDLPLSELRKKA